MAGIKGSMTIEETSKRYNIPIEILKMYEKWNLCGEVKNIMGSRKYDDKDIERLGMIMTLHNMGFNNSEIEKYMRLYLKGEESDGAMIEIIKKKRAETLDEIHFQEKRLQDLDYLKYKIEKKENFNL